MLRIADKHVVSSLNYLSGKSDDDSSIPDDWTVLRSMGKLTELVRGISLPYLLFLNFLVDSGRCMIIGVAGWMRKRFALLVS